jgi:SAM-dependent methyltransferase
MGSPYSPTDLQQLYEARFKGKGEYRQELWAVLSQFFTSWIASDSSVLDLGCGWCEFINSIHCRSKFAMDLNPDAKRFANADVKVLQQDCSARWAVEEESLDVIFTSNFFEHLPTKTALEATLVEARRALKANGRLIAMGPNIRCLAGEYWDFFDHHLPLTELSLAEVLGKCGFQMELVRARFLPYTMSRGLRYPFWTVRMYLSMPFFWRFFGKQFLVVARKRPSAQRA